MKGCEIRITNTDWRKIENDCSKKYLTPFDELLRKYLLHDEAKFSSLNRSHTVFIV